ncbi:ParB N-terminal domain-containing protein [Gluconacetobacter entanii]|uniref:ParB N-terminal domain-containing protein n=1 Tax=Gluconacetobacter entanii TaxID=108528 RepID=UPI001C932EA3|nr:ParB N-terminal domain-containing protein [Gluconacetobacter entanii]MBY4640323.1 ParB N-terminal domain-containing protein [Gluconacetobacter entanii]MCW4579903.1 ParB N-terminal domain-containing protein [Gluconacetobacter entanii]MCW4584616.1 ParB N-terminal domain-containing protein [Gluconacetobacter entanii]MCW4588122.1 ParB N-terminal domain-containing protein [Gluconacetobacter entanii]
MNVKKLKLADIDPRIEARIRPINEGYAEILAASFKERGQDTAIEVRYGSGEEDAPKYILVAGGHRFRAAELAEWTEINASISKLNADEARIKEIDENLLRQELDVLSRARSLYERKEVYLKLNPTTGHGGRRKKYQVPTIGTCSTPRFSVDAASRIGVSESTIHAYIALYRSLQPETVKAIQGTTLADDRAELLYIGKIESPIEQVSIVKKALEAGKKPSELAASPTPIPTEAMWLKLGKKEAARVLRLDLPARRVLLDELVKAKIITREQIVMEGAA